MSGVGTTDGRRLHGCVSVCSKVIRTVNLRELTLIFQSAVEDTVVAINDDFGRLHTFAILEKVFGCVAGLFDSLGTNY